MGTVTKLSGLAAAVAMTVGAMSLSPAIAADLLVDPPVIEAPETYSTGGWYLRGDITYDFRSSEGGTYYENGMGMFSDVDMDDSYDIGIGIGYQINDYLRADVTGEYVFGAEWRGNTLNPDFTCAGLQAAGGGSITDGTEPGTCATNESADVSMIKLLGNAYLDLGTFGGFTPYVGAGIGGAYVMYDDYKSTTTGTVQACCLTLDQRADDFGGESSWRFAYALHAGASFDVSHKMKLDVGYSYTDISGGAMGSFLGGGKPRAYDDGFTDHVIRAGVRYSLW
ncbi:outer membrane protein [Pseudahrensia aquimaris]|uniref:Outer membrane protein n=1 Tax=Pseudahrensia aquimaris TaxID=744461 RepID=A0ABW3FCJ5_9HYPH